MSLLNADKEAREDAVIVMNAFMREWKSSNDMVSVKNAVQAWLEKYQTPTYIDILKKVGYMHGDLWDRLNVRSDAFGMNAFILCGDHMTMNKISDALLSFSREQSLHAEMRELNKDDKIVLIEKKGYFVLSVNGRAYSGVPVFSGGYLRD